MSRSFSSSICPGIASTHRGPYKEWIHGDVLDLAYEITREWDVAPTRGKGTQPQPNYP
jgi:hypothetical protein